MHLLLKKKREKRIHNQLSLATRKPVFGVFDQVRLKSACSATETSQSHEIAHIKKLEMLYYPESEQQRCCLDCADVQADLRLCCSHMAKTGFLMTWLNLQTRAGARTASTGAIS